MTDRSAFFLRACVLAFAVVLVLPGCSSNSFVGKRYDNFSAYYNTFYNARQAYAEATKTLTQEEGRVDRDAYLPLFPQSEGANARAFQEPVIDRSADLLRDHPDSKWVDDALLLIGQAYFYQQNYVGSEQKFREVIGLASDLRDEARFWLARTLIASERFDEASAFLLETLADEEAVDGRWRGSLRLALSGLYVKQQRWDAAAEQLELGIELERDKALRARAQFLIGQVYEAQDRFGDAAEAYDAVLRLNPPFGLDYAARINAIRSLALGGRGEVALERVARMQRDDKYYDTRAEVGYMRGFVLKAMGQPDEAFLTFDALLYDTDADFNVQSVRGQAHYALGELYRDAYQDYVMAAAHFDTASTSLRGPSTGGRTRGRGASADAALQTRAAIIDAVSLAQTFGAFAEAREAVSLQDSLLALGALGEEEFEARILAIRQQRAREAEAERRRQERRQIEQQFGGSTSGGSGRGEDAFSERRGSQSQAGDTGVGAGTPGGFGDPETLARGTASSMTTVAAGFLAVKDPVRIREGRRAFIERWGPRPLVDNWRRREAVESAALAASDGGEADLPFDLADTNVEDALPQIDMSVIPRDSASVMRSRTTRARARYEVGNVLFLAMNRPDSAATWYRAVIEEDADLPVATRAYYALAEVQQTLGDTLAARRLYQQLLVQGDDYALQERARERLGETARQPERPTADTLALAEAAYEAAYLQWQADRFADALDAFVGVTVAYPATPSAPQALLAAGSTYAEWAARDSLDLFAPIPFTIPDTVLLAARIAERGTLPVAVTPADEVTPTDSLAATPPDEPAPDSAEDEDIDAARRLDQAVPDRAVLDRRRAGRDEDSTGEAPRRFDPERDRAERLGEERENSETETIRGEADRSEATRDETDRIDEEGEGSREVDTRGGTDGVSRDTTAVALIPTPSDSLRSAPASTDSAASQTDTTALGPPPILPVDLARVYDVIATEYGDTPYAALARRLRATLEARRPRPAIDSLAVAADSLGVLPDSTGMLAEALRGGDASETVAPDDSSEDTTPEQAERPVLTREERAAQRAALGLPPGAPLPGEEPFFDTFDQAPQLIGGENLLMMRLKYPPEAAEEGVEADVEVHVLLDDEGGVLEAVPTQPTGTAFEAEAVRVLLDSRFTPGIRGNQTVRARLTITVPFRLDGAR